jgi:PKD repeat protein
MQVPANTIEFTVHQLNQPEKTSPAINGTSGMATTSSMASPTHQYESGGTYAVALTTSNMLGCHTTLQKVVQVYFTPTSNFTNDLACSDNSATFYDQSTVNPMPISRSNTGG